MMLRPGANFHLKLRPEPKKMQMPAPTSISAEELTPQLAYTMVLVLAYVVHPVPVVALVMELA